MPEVVQNDAGLQCGIKEAVFTGSGVWLQRTPGERRVTAGHPVVRSYGIVVVITDKSVRVLTPGKAVGLQVRLCRSRLVPGI